MLETPQTLIAAFTVNTTRTDFVSVRRSLHQTVALPDGTFLVVYQADADGDGTDELLARRFDHNGAALGSEMPLRIDTGVGVTTFDVVALDNGQLAVAVETGIGVVTDTGALTTVPGIVTQLFDLASGVATGISGFDMQIADPNAVIVKPSLSGRGLDDLKLAFVIDGEGDEPDRVVALSGLSDGVFTVQTDLSFAPTNGFPELASATLANGEVVTVYDPDGNLGGAGTINFHLTVTDRDGTIVAARGPFAGKSGNNFDVDVVGLTEARFVLAYRNGDGFDSDIILDLFDVGGGTIESARRQDGTVIGPIEVASGGTVRDENFSPKLVALGDGGFIVFYDQRDEGNAIRGQRFDGDGNRVGGNFVVSNPSQTVADPSAALLADGRIAVTVLLADGRLQTTLLSLSGQAIVGTGASDILPTTDSAEEIFALGGDDSFNALGGDDTVDGGAGDDLINGGFGNDLINDLGSFGASGTDTLLGGPGDDTIRIDAFGEGEEFDGGEGTDLLDLRNLTLDVVVDLVAAELGSGSTTTARAAGFEGAVTGDGDDLIRVKNIIDGAVFRGGEGRDALDLTSADQDILVDLEAGTIAQGGGVARIAELEDIRLGQSDDVVRANRFVAGQRIHAGGGIDLLDLSERDADVFVSLGTATLAGGGNEVGISVIGFENVKTGAGDDEIAGSAGANLIDAGAGDDLVIAGDGNDTVAGGDGSDFIQGGAGDDVLFGDSGALNEAVLEGDGGV